MNADRLLELSDFLIGLDRELEVQSGLEKLVRDLDQVISNPGHAPSQTQFAQAFEQFRLTWAAMASWFSPTQVKLISEIRGAPFFIDDVPSQLDEIVRGNSITPAVVRSEIETFRTQREQYLTTLISLRDSLKHVGIETYKLDADTAEIGLLLPRDLFDNELGGLVKELRTINRIMRAFSEAALGKPEPVEVHQISTSDPIFFFGLDPATIALLAGAVTWALKTWKDVEEIRKIRTETQKVKSFSKEEIEEIFDSKIQKEVRIAIDQKVDEIIPAKDGAGRHHEQRSDMAWALESILGRIERGMTVELRFLPPKEGEPIAEQAASFETLKATVPQLQFPEPDKIPVLALPPSDPPSEQPRT
ncbi:hypothetical protein ACFQX9_30030 [Bradyrhizobium sp. GCM10028915]|uniref:hypothetical protein n=1 Tax=Bradyrhizobium sp. GCM10028915 TaxID=3273385 RepID=UPI003605FEC5